MLRCALPLPRFTSLFRCGVLGFDSLDGGDGDHNGLHGGPSVAHLFHQQGDAHAALPLRLDMRASASAMASTASIRRPIQRIQLTAMELPSTL